LLIVLAGSALAAPVVTVRARTRVQIEDVARIGDSVQVRGTLVDAATGEPVPGAEVRVEAGGEAGVGSTRADGTFFVRLPLAEGEFEFVATYTESDFQGGAEWRQVSTVGKGRLQLRLSMESSVELSAESVELGIAAESEGNPVAVNVEVAAADGAAGVPRGVARVDTGPEGRVTVDIPRAKLGGPGEKRVVVRFTGNRTFNPAATEAHVLVMTDTILRDLQTPARAIRYEGDLEVSGRLVDGEGTPVVGAVVGLELKGARVEEVSTDGDGAFEFEIPAAKLGVGPASMALVHVSRVAWRRGINLPARVVFVLEPRPVPLAYPIGAFAITAAGLLAFALWRVRPFGRRSAPRKPPAETQGGTAEAPPSLVPGLKVARPGLISSLRRAHDFGISGVVRDCVRQTGIPWATVLFGDAEPRAVSCGPDGDFTVEELPAGEGLLTVRAPGYVTFSLKLSLPHRGELRGVHIDLVPVRELIFNRYQEVAAPLLPDVALWGKWTPREILAHVRGKKPTGALGELTDLVEDAYFSVRAPDEAVISSADEAVARARAELQR
jgi:hypothetical protein